MSSRTDDLKGRAKEAAGDISDDDDLKREGKSDQAGAKLKDKIEGAKDWVEDKIDSAKDKVDDARSSEGR